MATVAQYTNALKQSSAVVARKMGVNFAGTDKQTRVMVRVILGMFATLIELLVEKGVFTDAEIQAKLNISANLAYTDEPLVTPEPQSAAVEADTIGGSTAIPDVTP